MHGGSPAIGAFGQRDDGHGGERHDHPQRRRPAWASRRPTIPTSAGTVAPIRAVSGATRPIVPRDSAR